MEESMFEINKDILKKYYADLIELEDWIPTLIRVYLPLGIEAKLGTKVINKQIWAKRLYEHKLHCRNFDSYYELENWEVKEFLKKYPKFKPIFKKI